MTELKHSGSGDNVAGNKTTNVIVNISKKILLVAGLMAILGGAVYYFFFNEKQISGHLFFRDNKPVENANISVQTPNGSVKHTTTTDDQGKFEIRQLYFFDKGLRLEVEYHNEISSFDLDSLLAVSAKEIIVHLGTAVAPYKITYYNLKGHSVDFLLEGFLKNSAGTSLEEDIFVVQNAIYKNLKSLKDRFHYTNDMWSDANMDGIGAYFTLKTDRSELSPSLFTAQLLKQDEYDENPKAKTAYVLPKGMEKAIWGTGENIALQKSIDTIIYEDKYQWFDYYEPFKWRYGNANDLLTFEDGMNQFDLKANRLGVNFLKHITNKHFPKEFIKIRRYVDDCGGVNLEFFETAALQVQVGVIENISDEVIEVSEVEVKENPQKGLRYWSADQAYFDKTTETKWMPVPPVSSKLKKGESLIIPLSIQFKNDSTYVFDPSIAIQNVKINTYSYATRMYDPQSISIKFTVEMGSCPYAYTWWEEGLQWRVEDHIIDGYSSPQKEAYDTLQIRRFDGRLMIRENDPETSYLDLVSILAVDASQNQQQWYPDFTPLSADDGVYHQMNQGDTILLAFPGYQQNTDDVDYYIISKGYYLLYN